MEGVDCLVTLLVGDGPKNSWPTCQELAISGEFGGNVLPVETSVLDKDPISDDPSDHREINYAELLSEEIGATDLVRVALEVFHPLGHSGDLKLRSLGMENAEVSRYDVLVNEIDPDPGLSGFVGISWSQAGLVLGIEVFKELEDDMRVVKGFTLIRESGDQSFGIES